MREEEKRSHWRMETERVRFLLHKGVQDIIFTRRKRGVPLMPYKHEREGNMSIF